MSTLYEYWHGQGSQNDFKAALWACVSFTPTNGHVSTSVKIKIYRIGSGATIGNITVSLRACDGAHKPTGGDLAIAPVLAATAVGTGTGGAEYEFTWNTPVLVNAATEYAVVARTSGGDSNNFIQWKRDPNEPINYGFRSPDSGVTWSQIDLEYWFEDWGEIDIETYPATYVKPYSAVGNAYLEETANITELGIEWGTTDGGPYPNEAKDIGGGYYAGLFSFAMGSLSASQVYYYRSKMLHSTYGWIYGNQESFTTPTAIPEARTDPPSDVTTSTIDAVGNILSTGGDASCDKRGFVYGLTSQADPGNVAPGASGYDSFAEDTGTFSTGSFTKQVTGLTASRVYYVRAYCHNASAGYDYGEELMVLTHDTVNILYPTSVSSGGVRFDSSPGGGYPVASGTIGHHILCRAEDTVWTSTARWGYLTGGFIYERYYYNDNYYTDLFNLSNPIRRTGTIVKVKWKAIVWRNSYPYGKYKRELYTHATQYTGTIGDIHPPGPDAHKLVEIFYNNPNTSAAWTLTELDDLIAGITLGNEATYGIAAADLMLVYALWANAEASADGASRPTPTTIRLNGTVVEDEAEACEVYFEWGPTVAYGNSTAPQSKVKGESFTADITTTPPIHFRAVIETESGETFYSADYSYSGSSRCQANISS